MISSAVLFWVGTDADCLSCSRSFAHFWWSVSCILLDARLFMVTAVHKLASPVSQLPPQQSKPTCVWHCRESGSNVTVVVWVESFTLGLKTNTSAWRSAQRNNYDTDKMRVFYVPFVCAGILTLTVSQSPSSRHHCGTLMHHLLFLNRRCSSFACSFISGITDHFKYKRHKQ